jgi:hypothetical protein
MNFHVGCLRIDPLLTTLQNQDDFGYNDRAALRRPTFRQAITSFMLDGDEGWYLRGKGVSAWLIAFFL